VIEATMPAVREQLGILDKAVAGTSHLVGDHFTFADINLMPLLHRVGQAPEGAAALAEARHLAAYYRLHAVRPSFVRTDPPAGPPGRA
jgi:glutathione S-transferase